MSVESITRKRLPDITAKDVSFVCVMDNLILLEYSDARFPLGEERRITLPLDQLDLSVAWAKVKAGESTMTDDEKRAALEDYARSQPKPEFDPQDNF